MRFTVRGRPIPTRYRTIRIPNTYAQRFRDYYTQMKAVDPTIKIGAVAVTGEDSYANYTTHPAVNPRTGQTHYGWTPVMLATLKSLRITPDFLIYHRYPEAPGAESDTGLLTSSGTWATDAADLRQQLNDYLGAAAQLREHARYFRVLQRTRKHRTAWRMTQAAANCSPIN